jgi:uncharacterized membrane protein YccC
VNTQTVATTDTQPHWEAFLKYLPSLDPGRVEHAIQVTLAVTISYFLSLYLFPYKEGFWSAVSALIVLSMFLGTTLNRAAHRLAGNTTGVIAGLFMLGTVSQDRLAGTIAFSLAVALLVYGMARSRFYLFWGWLIVGLAETFLYPLQATELGMWRFAVYRGSDIAVGIMVAVLVAMFVFPKRAAKNFEQLLSHALGQIEGLWGAKVSALAGDTNARAQVEPLAFQCVASYSQLQTLLDTAALDTARFERNEARYRHMVGELRGVALDLAELDRPVTSGEIAASPVAAKLQLPSFEAALLALRDQARNLPNLANLPRDGGQHTNVEQETRPVRESLETWSKDCDYSRLGAFDAGALLALRARMQGLSRRLARLRDTFLSLEAESRRGLGFFLHPHPINPTPPVFHRSLALGQAATIGLVTFVWLWFWIYLQWPSGGTAVGLAVIFLRMLILIPVNPETVLSKGVAAGLILSAPFYFLVLPSLEGFFQLATLVFIPSFLVLGYFIAAPTPQTCAIAYIGGIFFLVVLGVQQQQSFATAFHDYATLCWVLLGGISLPLVAWSVIWPIVPEALWRKNIARFFVELSKLIRMDKVLPGQTSSAAHPGEEVQALSSILTTCKQWAAYINYNRQPPETRDKINHLLAAMAAVTYESLQLIRVRREVQRMTLPQGIIQARSQFRQATANFLVACGEALRQRSTIPPLLPVLAASRRVKEELENLRTTVAPPGLDSAPEILRVLEFSGGNLAFAKSVVECHRKLLDIDWVSLARNEL